MTVATQLRMSDTVGPFPDEECADEEECEIDWDSMPGMGGANDDDENENENIEAPSPGQQEEAEAAGTESARVRLEMMWGLKEAEEDCLVDMPETCGSEPCEDCRGRGVVKCRFCNGSAVIGFMRQRPVELEEQEQSVVGGREQQQRAPQMQETPSFMSCTICREGHEVCTKCRGTGWIAGWATLSDSTASN